MDLHLVQVLLLGLEEFKQSCHNLFVLSTRKKNAPYWRGGRKLLHHKLLGHQIPMSHEYMYIKKTHNFPLLNLWNAKLQMREVAQKLMSTPLFSFQDLKLSTRDIITVLEDTLNITSGPLLILDPHATEVPSNTLERHLISSRVADCIHNLVISFSMVKLVGFLSSNSIFTYLKKVKNTSFVDLLFTNGVWITIFSTKSLTHFQRWCLVKKLPSPLELPLSTILSHQSKWEDIHPKWYFLIHVPNQCFLEFNSPRRWACLTPNYENLCGRFTPLVGA